VNASLPYKPEKFLALAAKLVNDTDYDEATRVRTAIGRAYYASFLSARDRLESLGYKFPNKSTHKAVYEVVNGKNTMIGNMLAALHDARIESDYQMKSGVNLKVAKKCVTISKMLAISVPSLSGSPP
jgi:uncharacterized protein (UPF0332 family)